MKGHKTQSKENKENITKLKFRHNS